MARDASQEPDDVTVDQGWTGRSVLVTGAGGFLGRHVAARLLAAGARVRGTTRRAREDGSELDEAIRWHVLDVADAAALDAAVDADPPEVVVHLAGHVSAAVDAELVQPTFSSLLASSITLLDAARVGRLGRLVLIGSTDEPLPGTGPSSPYGAAKAAMTSYGRLYATAFDTSVVTVRPAEVFGPGQKASKLLPYSAACALRGEAPRLAAGGRRGDWIYVDDVVDGLLAAACDARPGAELDLGTGVLRTNREMVQGLLDALGVDVTPAWGALPVRPGEQARAADLARTTDALSWRPRVSLREGLQRTADAARAAFVTAAAGPAADGTAAGVGSAAPVAAAPPASRTGT